MKIKANSPFLLSWVPALAAMGAIFYASSLPGKELNLPSFAYSDKVFHFLAYMLLGWLITLRFDLRRRLDSIQGATTLAGAARALDIKGLATGMLFGVSDEIHQLFVPLRTFELGDMAADFLGVTAGYLTYRILFLNSESRRVR
ncbi:MAG: VanZ family protein [Fibrobacterota bacterium]|nr:VanZ family protein [Fibrobacterota bacterium]